MKPKHKTMDKKTQNNKAITTKYGRVMETVWIVIGLISFVAGVYSIYTAGFKNSRVFILLAAVSFFMYILRRNLRKGIERKNQEKEEQTK